MPVKIGILGHDFITWAGGVDFLRQIIDSLLAVKSPSNLELHFLLPVSGPRLTWRRIRRRTKQTFKSFAGAKGPSPGHAPSAEIISESFEEFRDRIYIHQIDIGRPALIRAVSRLGLKVVLPAVHSLGTDFPKPWVGYAYDFQHKYLPQHFSPDDFRSRDEHFTELLTQAKAVIVNSRAVAADIARFVPEATAQIVVLPFAPAPNADWLEDRAGVLLRYGISPPYFMISNQFWVHKDHATAFKAFGVVAGKNPAVSMVCTGSSVDSRDATYFPKLMQELKNANLDQRTHILGLIPKRDQIEIMKNARAVIQPSLFEGGPGGGAVYDAMALDVHAIVSDIPPNREIECANVVYFPTGDVTKLAEHMMAAIARPRANISPSELLSLGHRRRAACGAALLRTIEVVLDDSAKASERLPA